MASYCDALMATPLATSWWIEPAIASASFFGFMFFFRFYEDQPYGGRFHPLTISAVLALLTYWLGIGLWVSVVPRPVGAASGCPHDMAEMVTLLAELVCGIMGYDFVLFCLHLLMHKVPAFGRCIGHGKHHRFSGDTGARKGGAFRTTDHSLADGAIQVLSNILVQRHTPWGSAKSRLARWLHNVIVIEMLVESHSNSKRPRLARALFSGVDGHHLHHRDHGAPYQQFFGYLDAAWMRWNAGLDAKRGRH